MCFLEYLGPKDFSISRVRLSATRPQLMSCVGDKGASLLRASHSWLAYIFRRRIGSYVPARREVMA